ncbi:hypothetical protein Tco_0885265 [Tanacetum coccineum]
MCQNLQVQVEELKSVNESLNLTVKVLSKARALAEATLRERDEMINAQCKKIRLLEERSEPFYEVPSEFDSELVHDTQDNLEKDLILMSSSVQKEYNDLLASNDVLKQRLKTKFKFSKHDTSLEKMIEMIEKEYESNVSKIFITSSMFETKNLELGKEMGDKVKCFYEEKKAFETKILKLEKVLAQRVKDFDNVKTELSRRTDKFETYFANLEKENALLKSQLASQNYISLQKENNDLRTSYNVLKEKYKTSCAKLEKENNNLKMRYKRLFDSIKQKRFSSWFQQTSFKELSVHMLIELAQVLKILVQNKYAKVIGSLMYAMTCARPDIAYVVGRLSRHTSSPGKEHWDAVNRVFKYLNKTMDYGLEYSGDSSILEGIKETELFTRLYYGSKVCGTGFMLQGSRMATRLVNKHTLMAETYAANLCAL